MGQSSSERKQTIRHQFDRYCKLVLHGEKVNYEKEMEYRGRHEISLSQVSEEELNRLNTMDEYIAESEMEKSSKCSKLLSCHIIAAAASGDVEAINKVLKHYEGYIAALATRRLYDECGILHYCVDETLRRRLETKLITKILDFKIA